jgi:membrane protease YdiL (CAAX protease family)
VFKVKIISGLKEKLALILIVIYLLFPETTIIVILIYLVFFYDDEKKVNLKKNGISYFKLISHFIPIIYLISLTSKLLLFEYEEQKLVTDLKNSADLDIKLVISIILIAPIIEEIIFRSFIYRLIKRYTNILLSSLLTALLFGLIHDNILAFTILFMLSIFLTYMYEKYGNLIYSILTHMFFNTLMLIFIISG